MPAGKPDLSHVVGLPPVEAIRYFEERGMRITFNWQEMWRDAHARAFTVASVTKQDMLKDIRDITAQAISEGKTARWHLNELAPLLQKKGWWGKGLVPNPETGEVVPKRMGSPARLNLIYRQNTQAAYNAGRYAQQKEDADIAPYWRYVAILDQKTRPGHAALHGKVWRHDDPAWDALYPPNGWGCRCRAEALSEWALKRRGFKVEDSAGHIVEREVPVRNPVTGEKEMRPVTGYRPGGAGSQEMLPDPGFDYNPGKTFLRDRLAEIPEPPQTQATNWKELGLPRLRSIPQSERLPAPALLPVSPTREQAEKKLADALGFNDRESLRVVQTAMGPRTIWRGNLGHMVEKNKDARERYAGYVLPTLQKPHEVWLKEHTDGKLRENYIGLFQDADNALLVVVRVNRDGSLVWNYMRRDIKGMERLRDGWLVYEKKKS